MNVTYKHLRLFVEEENEGWVASVCDLDQFQFVHDGRLFHSTVEAARSEAESKANEILKETINVDWSEMPVLNAHG